MAETYLIAAPAKAKNGNVYRVVKDRAWDDMPFSYLVQVRRLNYERGKTVATWRVCDRFDNEVDARNKWTKRIG